MFERPLEDGGRSRRIAPFAVVALAAFVAVLLIGTRSRAGEVIVARSWGDSGTPKPLMVASIRSFVFVPGPWAERACST